MNTESKYTKGKWELANAKDENRNVIIKTNKDYGNQKYFVIGVKHSFDAVGFYYPISNQSDEEMIANANILATSKDMYESLKECREWFEKHGESYEIGTPHCFIQAKKVLGKAEGKTA